MRYLISFLIISFLIIIICPLVLAQAPETQEVLALWNKIINWIRPWLQTIWYKTSSFLGKEVEKRKPEIQEEFEKEKQEMKEEIPKVTKPLWQRFKELIK